MEKDEITQITAIAVQYPISFRRKRRKEGKAKGKEKGLIISIEFKSFSSFFI